MTNLLKIYLLAFISFLVGTSQFIIVGILDQIANSLSISLSSAGQLVGVYALASAIGTPLVIMVISKMDQRTQLLYSLVVFNIGNFAIPIFHSYFFIVLSRIIVGIGAGVFVVTAYSMSAKLAEKGKQGTAMSNIAIGFSLSLVLGVPLGRIITTLVNWQTIFWLIGILSLLFLFIAAKSLPKTTEEPPVALHSQLILLKQPKIIFALGITFLFFISFSLINTYITLLLFSIKPLSDHEMSTILFALGIASFIGSKLAGFLADHIGIIRTLFGSMSLHLAMLLALLLVSHSILLTSIVLFTWVLASWIFGPTQSFNLASIAPHSSNVLLSLNSSFVQLGFAVGAGIGGITITYFHILTLSYVGILCVISAIVMLFFSINNHSAE